MTMNVLKPIDFVCIDIANNFGLDKELFETRIQWVKDNYKVLEDLADNAKEDKIQYQKGVMALREIVAGKQTGHLISLDSTCSGIQILSAITGCKAGARITNLTPENVRFDAYTEITNSMNKLLRSRGENTFTVDRGDAKDAVMQIAALSRNTKLNHHVNSGKLLTNNVEDNPDLSYYLTIFTIND